MHKSRYFLVAGIGLASTLSALSPLTWAQDAASAASGDATTAPLTPAKPAIRTPRVKPPVGSDAPNTTSVFAPVKVDRPLKVAIYDGAGSGAAGIEAVCGKVTMIPGSTVVKLKPEEVGTTDLTSFDFIVFSGGSGSAQAKAIGDKGLQNVRTYVKNGGGYLGICAGAYLACSNYPWSLGILNAKTLSPRWQRGGAFLQLELSDDGRAKFGDVKNKFWVRYHNGPVIGPDNKADLPPYTVEAWFRSETAQNNTPAGIQVNSPAVISGVYGKGRVLTISPHPEDSRGLENFVPHAMAWLSNAEASPKVADSKPVATKVAETKAAEAKPAEPVIKLDPALVVPDELAGQNATDGAKTPNTTSVIPPVKAKRPLKVGIYQGLGALPECVKDVQQWVPTLNGSVATLIKDEDFAKIDLSQFDILAFPGGLSSNQGKGLGKAGRDAVVRYIYNGGGYLGICAGAYLATSGNDWSLGILNARTVSPNWLRGKAYLKMQLSDDGKKLYDGPTEPFWVRYNNGPIIEPANKPELPPYTIDAYFRTEVDGYKTTPVGIQVNSPAVIRAKYGKGKVLTISPHPESSKGLENFIPRALVWLGDKKAK